jgi:hypothetical protein
MEAVILVLRLTLKWQPVWRLRVIVELFIIVRRILVPFVNRVSPSFVWLGNLINFLEVLFLVFGRSLGVIFSM